ncbi:MAG: M23 family metallopeptidase [Mailhella sp.]|nr:M23 family metallopeptidase [Mailhella sp.]
MKEVLAKNCRKASRVIAGLLAVFVLSSCVPGSRDQQPTTVAFVDAALHQQTAELINLSALRMRRSADGSSLKNMDVKWFEEAYHPVAECDVCKAYGVSISSPFGFRQDPVTGLSRGHTGVDIRAPKGNYVLAFKGGVVVESRFMNGYGLVVDIKQYDGNIARYAHLNASAVAVGQHVDTGVVIGEVGMTGRVTGSHLHFEIINKGVPQDPMRYLRQVQQVVQCPKTYAGKAPGTMRHHNALETASK